MIIFIRFFGAIKTAEYANYRIDIVVMGIIIP